MTHAADDPAERRAAMTRATMEGVSSPEAGNSGVPRGSAHSPPTSNLPITRGRCPSGMS